MQHPRYLFILLLLSALCWACNEEAASEDGTDGYEVILKHPAGSDFEEFVSQDNTGTINYPFNIATFRNLKNKELSCILISKELPSKKKLKVMPIAMMQMMEFGERKRFPVCIPMDPNHRSVAMQSFSDFVVKNAGVKEMIQTWLLTRCGMGCSEYMGWSDDNAASHYIQSQ